MASSLSRADYLREGILEGLLDGAVRDVGASSVEIITEIEQFAKLESEWRALFSASPAASPPLTWEWINSWWRIYGTEYGRAPGGLRVIAIRRQGSLVGAAPLYLCASGFPMTRRLGFISSGERDQEATCAEYLDLLYLPEHKSFCVDQIAKVVFDRSRIRWDQLVLSLVSEKSAIRELVAPYLPGLRIRKDTFVAPMADLSGGFESYLSLLSSNSRQQFRRLIRDAEKERFTFSVADSAESAARYLRELIGLHQARWRASGEPGAFNAHRAISLHDALLRVLVPRGEAVICRVSEEDRPIALIYGFLFNGKFDFYQSGAQLDGETKVKRPGILSHLLTMRYLADERGVHTYDFLAGDAPYKTRMSTSQNLLEQVTLTRHSVGGLASLIRQKAQAVLRKLRSSGNP